MIRHNLSPDSAPWANEVERRIAKIRATQERYGLTHRDWRNASRSERLAPAMGSLLVHRRLSPGEYPSIHIPVPEGARSGAIVGFNPTWVDVRNPGWFYQYVRFGVGITLNSFYEGVAVHEGLQSWNDPIPGFDPGGAKVDTSYGRPLILDVSGQPEIVIRGLCTEVDYDYPSTEFDVEYSYAVFWSDQGGTTWVQ